MTGNTVSRSYVLEAPGKAEIKEFPLPELGDGELLVQVEAAGIDGADALMFGGGIKLPEYPVIMGDELVGRIVDAGTGALSQHGVELGDRVTVEACWPCGVCDFCTNGNYYMHEPLGELQYGWIRCDSPPHLWGSFSEYVFVPRQARVHRVPEDLPVSIAIFAISNLANGIRWGSERLPPLIGRTVIVIGPGPQGIACALAARESGARDVIVCGLTADGYALDLALRLGATATVDVEREDVESVVREVTGGSLADAAVCCAPGSRAASSALALTKPRGHVNLIGFPSGDIDASGLMFGELTVTGSRGHPFTVTRALDLAQEIHKSGRYDLTQVVSHRLPLDRIEEGFAVLRRPGEERLKVVVSPSQPNPPKGT